MADVKNVNVNPCPSDNKKSIVGGLVCNAAVVKKPERIAGIEKGQRSTVNAIVVHQTGGSTLDTTIADWKEKEKEGAHFIIDTDGTVTQTASLDSITYHVGHYIKARAQTAGPGKTEIRPRTADNAPEYDILYKKGANFEQRKQALDAHERAKEYPDRYPVNNDSIGIELVGRCDKSGKPLPKGETCAYVDPTPAQNAALTKLVNLLKDEYHLGDGDIYTHPEVSYKNPTEAAGANWNYGQGPTVSPPK